jgi:hypothetical protein
LIDINGRGVAGVVEEEQRSGRELNCIRAAPAEKKKTKGMYYYV